MYDVSYVIRVMYDVSYKHTIFFKYYKHTQVFIFYVLSFLLAEKLANRNISKLQVTSYNRVLFDVTSNPSCNILFYFKI